MEQLIHKVYQFLAVFSLLLLCINFNIVYLSPVLAILLVYMVEKTPYNNICKIIKGSKYYAYGFVAGMSSYFIMLSI